MSLKLFKINKLNNILASKSTSRITVDVITYKFIVIYRWQNMDYRFSFENESIRHFKGACTSYSSMLLLLTY